MAHRPFTQDKAPSHRPARFGQAVKEYLCTMVPDSLSDPRLENLGYVTITNVDMSKDLKNATVYFTLSSEDKGRAKEVTAAFNHAAGYLRNELRSLLQTKITPQLAFKYDHGTENTTQIDTLLKQIHSGENKS